MERYQKRMRLAIKRGLTFGALALMLGGVGLFWKGPTLIRHLVKTSLEENLSPLGMHQVDIGHIGLGWGRIHLRDIQSKPQLTIRQLDIRASPLLRIKEIRVVGAALDLTGIEKTFKEGEAKLTLKEAIKNLKDVKAP